MTAIVMMIVPKVTVITLPHTQALARLTFTMMVIKENVSDSPSVAAVLAVTLLDAVR